MSEGENDSGIPEEDTVIHNLPLYTECKADGIYRYRRRVPKALVGRIGKGYLYRNLGRRKDDVARAWPEAHAEIERIIALAQEGADKAGELLKRKDHRSMVLHLVEEHFGKEAAELLDAGKVDDNLDFALMDLADKLEGQYPKRTLAMMYGGILPDKVVTLSDVLDGYIDYKSTSDAATDRSLILRVNRCKADLEAAIGKTKLTKLRVEDITRQDANAYRDYLLQRMSPNSVLRNKNTINAAVNWYITENSLDMTSVFAGLLIKGAGASKNDRLPLTDEDLKTAGTEFADNDIAWALYITLRDTGARVAEISGLRVQDCDAERGCLHIVPTPWRRLKTKSSERSVPLSIEAMAALAKVAKGKTPEEPIFERYAKPRGGDMCSAMLMKRLRKTVTDKKVTMHSLRHRMKDKLRNTGCPEAISMAILGHSANTVAANYGSGYALEVMREHMEKVWGK